jgi:hypothetical protein
MWIAVCGGFESVTLLRSQALHAWVGALVGRMRLRHSQTRYSGSVVSRLKRLPVALFDALLYLSLREVALQGAQIVDE